VRRDQRLAILGERDVLLDCSERSLDRWRRFVDVDFDIVDRKPGRLEQVKRRADDELGFSRLDLDKRVDHRVQLEFVRARGLRERRRTGNQTPSRKSQSAKSHIASRYLRIGPAN
jgi:hypothetical protein